MLSKEITRNAFVNNEVTSQVSLLADIAENVHMEIHKN